MKNFKSYYAVIFTSTRTDGDNGYSEMADLMEELAKKQEGFISIDSARNTNSITPNRTIGITVSYWETMEAISNWKQQTDHLAAQQKGIKDWYSWYNVRICKVEREYDFNR